MKTWLENEYRSHGCSSFIIIKWHGPKKQKRLKILSRTFRVDYQVPRQRLKAADCSQ